MSERIALLFSGQGAQRAGMGKSLYDNSPAAKELFEKAEKLRPGTIAQCFEGTPGELSLTINTQPCLYCVDMAAASALLEIGVVPEAVAGFSLGELAALSFSGVFTFEDGFEIVRRRAKLMSDASADSTMAAVLKLDSRRVEELCEGFSSCYPVNYNCPGQTVVALKKDAVAEFSETVKRAGGRAVPLAVSGGFHSPFMDEAAVGLRDAVQGFTFSRSRLPVYSNRTAMPYGEGFPEGFDDNYDCSESYAEAMVRQINSPVRFQSIIENMLAAGIRTFIEVGVGSTLVNFVNKTASESGIEVFAFSVEDAGGLARAALLGKQEKGG